MKLEAVHHIQVTYPLEVEEAILFFYSQVLGLQAINPPEASDSGGWYLLGNTEIHVSREANANNQASRRHICFRVNDVYGFAEHLKAYDVEILPGTPIPGFNRFFIRDPGGNRIEIAELINNSRE
ncbi:glyoxalase/bleomycin resistance protein/dioxygenase [Nostoc sp. HK-01]|uniref:Glyoxalase/bleomycin resistance protein/dioxygenase n=1 Tax=Anabaenopsis circularis NIES-21 TaxID=1085406 RepID=A0A1Z4GMW5_9CYAN|nr:glyoxalase/bleomycin resistance protein/dioxygenase [Anabaenopsis circularis NIES-21]BBD62599.1 glyoxalase/bleomycin resistance protein/dioxygenase [Nostoc sp. HK-01]